MASDLGQKKIFVGDTPPPSQLPPYPLVAHFLAGTQLVFTYPTNRVSIHTTLVHVAPPTVGKQHIRRVVYVRNGGHPREDNIEVVTR